MSQALTTLTTESELGLLKLGEILSKSGYFTDVRDAAQAVVKMLAGRELGVGPIASMTGIFVSTSGKITYGANLLASIVKNSPKYDYRVVSHSDRECTLEFTQKGTPGGHNMKLGVSTFTLDDAVLAGLTTGKSSLNWKQYPRNMLFARALTNGVRWFCPDVFGGVTVYTPEEIEDVETAELMLDPIDPADRVARAAAADMKDVYSEGLEVGMELGKKLAAPDDTKVEHGTLYGTPVTIESTPMIPRQAIERYEELMARAQELDATFPADIWAWIDGTRDELYERGVELRNLVEAMEREVVEQKERAAVASEGHVDP